MRGIKRAGVEGLRQGVKKGEKLLMVWDSAAIDYGYWHKLKQSHGIYFLCRDNDIKRIACGSLPIDKTDPINAGVISDRQEGTSTNGHLVRIIEFEDLATNKTHRFITNERTLEPGMLALLYRMRWDIEKVFDEVKNHLNQKKAWAKSVTAKTMQGELIAINHNLMLKLQSDLEKKHDLTDFVEQKRRLGRRQKENTKVGRGSEIIVLKRWLLRSTQRGLKFIRWLRIQLIKRPSWQQSCAQLRQLYARS